MMDGAVNVVAEAYLDVLDTASFDSVEPPVLKNSASVWWNGNSGTIFVSEFRALENLDCRRFSKSSDRGGRVEETLQGFGVL